MTTTTSHRDCTHPSTKAARAACRKGLTTADLVQAVKDHAMRNYEKGGWDVIIECWDDAQIAERVEGATSIRAALRRFAVEIDVYSDRQADARNSAF